MGPLNEYPIRTGLGRRGQRVADGPKNRQGPLSSCSLLFRIVYMALAYGVFEI